MQGKKKLTEKDLALRTTLSYYSCLGAPVVLSWCQLFLTLLAVLEYVLHGSNTINHEQDVDPKASISRHHRILSSSVASTSVFQDLHCHAC